MSKDDDLLKEAREAFATAESAESHNRQTYKDDIKFAREGEQWPEKIKAQRTADGRPTLTINKMPAFIRQVVNDARQNKPSIKVHPADSGADPETAEVINGLIRNIEYSSNADVAYDTGTECAVTGGFGYWRIGLDYSYEDGFDMDLSIDRIANPLSVYGDPNSTAADSSDWNSAFIVDQIPEDQFKAKYKGKATTDFNASAWEGVGQSWRSEVDKTVTIAEWWKRTEVEKKIVRLSNDMVVKAEQLETDEDLQALLAGGITVIQERMAKCHEVVQHIMSGADIIESRKWLGKYIPIVPVYGDEFDIEGKRYYRSLIHSAIDAQRMFNYWRTTSTELVALAPRVPYIGATGSFASDSRWATANTQSHAYLEYDVVPGANPPQRQPLDSGVAAGALQEALNASDDMKSIIGLYDASLGARSNETSGKAIMARQREGDVSTFHFIDNMARAIRHTGRILIDLIPHVYSSKRIIRILGEDGTQEAKPINQPYPMTDPKTGQPMQDERGQAIIAMHDLSTGKYDLTVTTGPSFTTRREEAAYQMTEALRAYPEGAPIIMPELAKNLDWPGADKIAEKLEAMQQPQLPPEIQQQIEAGMQKIQQLEEENQQLKMDQAAEQAKLVQQQQADQAKIESTKQIEMIKLQADEQIAMAKIASEERIALAKARIQAQAAVQAAALKPQPTGATNGQRS